MSQRLCYTTNNHPAPTGGFPIPFSISWKSEQKSQTLSDQFTFEEEHFIVDLVFYNRLLRCFVLFDLKIGELKHQDIGQMQMYVHYYDRKVKLPEDNTQIFASKYETVLPSKEELQKLLEEQLAE